MNDATIDSDEVRAVLERVLQHADFASAPRLAAFLCFVVTETLEGRASRVKAYSIATTVFGRSESFDPQTNPVVRVEAMRLRQALSHYFETAGVNEHLEIRLERGTYVPQFIRRMAQQPAPETQPATPKVTRLAQGWRAPAALVVSALLLSGVSFALWAMRDRSVMGQIAPQDERAAINMPTIHVTTTAQEGAQRFFAENLANQLETALSRFDFPQVVRQPASPSDYQLAISTRGTGGGAAAIDIKIVHARTSTILWAREFIAETQDATSPVSQALSGEIATRVARTYGVVYSDMRSRFGAASADTIGIHCIVMASGALSQGSDEARITARQCLERTLAKHPDFSPAFASIAFLDAARYLDVAAPEATLQVIERARDHAQKALALAPHNARPHAALFWTRFFSGRFEDAFDSARIALELNPHSSDIRARIGAAHMLRGRFAQGAAMIEQSAANSRWTPGWQEFFMFLNAHLKGDDARAARHAMRKSAQASPLGHVARIIVAKKANDLALESEARRELKAQFPGFASNIPEALARHAMAPELLQRLLADLGMGAK